MPLVWDHADKPCSKGKLRVFFKSPWHIDSVRAGNYPRLVGRSGRWDTLFALNASGIIIGKSVQAGKYLRAGFRFLDSLAARQAGAYLPGYDWVPDSPEYATDRPYKIFFPGIVTPLEVAKLQRRYDSLGFDAKGDSFPDEVYLAVGRCQDQKSAKSLQVDLKRQGVESVLANFGIDDFDV